MKKLVYCLAFVLCACNPNLTVLNPEFHPTDRGWGSNDPVWRDEFNGQSTDLLRWVTANYCGGYNGEEQCYRPQNIAFDGAHMIITAQVESCGGDTIPGVPIVNEVGTVDCPNLTGPQTFLYTSARIHTRVNPPEGPHAWTYGRIEIRAKLPYGQGTWPAFWMMPVSDNVYGPWPRSGEIDILEAVNLHSPYAGNDTVQSNIHFCSYAGYVVDNFASSTAIQNCDFWDANQYDYHKVHFPMSRQLQSFQQWAPDLVSQFHTYAMEWSDYDIRFFVDDELIGQVQHGPDANNRAPFRHPFYLIINLAVGGNWPTNNGTVPVNTANWLQNPARAELVVDWVRVYACVPDATARNCIYRGQGLGRVP